MTRWNVTIGQTREEISSDLLGLLGFSVPYSNDETCEARDESHGNCGRIAIAEAVANGLHGDEAALYAIRVSRERAAAQTLETARQKVAELEAKAAADQRAAEGIAFARQEQQKRTR